MNVLCAKYLRTQILEHSPTSTVQNELISKSVPTCQVTQSEEKIDGILNSGSFEKCTELGDKKHSFLDPATAVADIDTCFAAEGQSINFM